MGEAIRTLETDSDWGSSEAVRFRELALRYQKIGQMYGVNLNPFRGPDMPLFSKASPDKRKSATDFLEIIVFIHEETIAAKEMAINSRQLIWRAFKRLGLVPPPGALDEINEHDVVVIYGPTQQAIFWNLQFFKFSSFTVEEMFFGVWYEFTRRSPEMLTKLYELSLKIISGEIDGVFHPDLPEHEVQEIGSLEEVKTMMRIKTGARLTSEGQYGGMMVVQEMRVIA